MVSHAIRRLLIVLSTLAIMLPGYDAGATTCGLLKWAACFAPFVDPNGGQLYETSDDVAK